ncbi:hypothetical protein [Paenibacillus elgii]|uniref:hypothetical protein n=1 Tax=Paenibacillus elgii TaxID=189691 RepID=UPI0013D386A6|nr:hypothetical protein [Paenibacillus elgii]
MELNEQHQDFEPRNYVSHIIAGFSLWFENIKYFLGGFSEIKGMLGYTIAKQIGRVLGSCTVRISPIRH